MNGQYDCLGFLALMESQERKDQEKLLLQTRCFEPRPPDRKSNGRVQYVVQIASNRTPYWVQIGLDQGVLHLERVPELKLVAGDTVLCMLWSDEEVLGELTMTWKTTGLDRVRVIAGARILNLRSNQIVAIIKAVQ